MNIIEKLSKMQTELSAPKSLFNKFGNYPYRSAESILESLKPLLKEVQAVIAITDELVQIGDRYYIKTTATLRDTEGEISTTAYAREEETKKGMDASQITGSASSYARKYALNGLFAIDDTKDADATNTHDKEEVKQKSNPKPKSETNATEMIMEKQISDTQIKALFTLANKKGYNSTSVLKAVAKKYNVPEIAQLSQSQYSSMVKGYEGLKDK